jgi:hypothetical protein
VLLSRLGERLNSSESGVFASKSCFGVSVILLVSMDLAVVGGRPSSDPF